jgi:hypothetical protein
MKRCPSCGQTYTDQNINFCLNDGELLSRLTEPSFSLPSDEPPPTMFADDSPPTLMMNQARITNQTNWQTPAQHPVPWQPQSPAGFASNLPAHLQPKNQTLPTVSLILGISSLIFICCFGGIWLGLPAAITGFIGMRNADMFPDRFAGRGMALTAMIIGTIAFFISIMQVILTAIGD